MRIKAHPKSVTGPKAIVMGKSNVKASGPVTFSGNAPTSTTKAIASRLNRGTRGAAGTRGKR